MNFSNLKPLVQDSFYDYEFYEYDVRKEAEEMIGTCTSRELTAGFLLIPAYLR